MGIKSLLSKITRSIAGLIRALFFHSREEEVEQTRRRSEASEKIEAAAAAVAVAGPEWSELPIDLLNNVAERLVANLRDYIRLRAVCKAWRSVRAAAPRPGTRLPWLLRQWSHKEGCLSFFSIAESKTFTVPLPPAAGALQKIASSTTCSGSCNGWLVLEDKQGLFLLNPITGALIQLPTAPRQLIARQVWEHLIVYSGGEKKDSPSKSRMLVAIAMSSDPAEGGGRGCTVVVISYRWSLVSIRIGEKDGGGGGGWRLMDDAATYNDVIYREGHFYAVDNICRVTIFESAGLTRVALVAGPAYDPHRKRLWRFAELSGELLLLCRFLKENPVVNGYMHPPKYATERFEIFKLKPQEGGGDEVKPSALVKVNDLGDNVLFYGYGSNGLACAAAAAAACPGGKRNVVYSSEEHPVMRFDHQNVFCCAEAAVYDVASAAVEMLPFETQIDCRNRGCCTPWFMPTL